MAPSCIREKPVCREYDPVRYGAASPACLDYSSLAIDAPGRLAESAMPACPSRSVRLPSEQAPRCGCGAAGARLSPLCSPRARPRNSCGTTRTPCDPCNRGPAARPRTEHRAGQGLPQQHDREPEAAVAECQTRGVEGTTKPGPGHEVKVAEYPPAPRAEELARSMKRDE